MKLRYRDKIFILVFLICFLSIFVVSLYFKTITKNFSTKNIVSSLNTDYSVSINDTSYYETNKLPSGMKYIASIIDKVMLDVNYSLTSDCKMDYDYTYSYYVATSVYDDDNKSKVLFTKEISISDEKEVHDKESLFSNIKDTLSIDYDTFNSLVAKFETSYYLSNTSDAVVVLRINGKSHSDDYNKDIIINEDIKLLTIPLSKQTIDITKSNYIGLTYEVINESNNFVIKNKVLFEILIRVFVLTLVFIFILIRVIYDNSHKHGYMYKNELRKILRDYDLIIANVDHLVDEEGYEIIKVTSFSELKDIHDNIGSPILYYEVIKNIYSCFEIVKDKYIYKYELNINNMKK